MLASISFKIVYLGSQQITALCQIKYMHQISLVYTSIYNNILCSTLHTYTIHTHFHPYMESERITLQTVE